MNMNHRPPSRFVPKDSTKGTAIWIPRGVRCEAYEPKKKRRPCDLCGGRGEWRWNAEVVCSKCLIEVKLEDQSEKVQNFIRKTLLVSRGRQEAEDELAGSVDTTTDPPTLTAKGYWKLAHVIVIMHRTLNRGKP